MQGPGDLSKPLMLCDVSWAQRWGWKTLSPPNYRSISEGEVLELPEITVFNEQIPSTGCGPLASNENPQLPAWALSPVLNRSNYGL